MKHYTDYTHNVELEERARTEVGSGEPCGFFVSLGNGVMEDGEGHLVNFTSSEEDISSKMIAHFDDYASALQFANGVYVGEDTDIGWVTVEGPHGEHHHRFTSAVPTVKYVTSSYGIN